jgi:hypothetical protein
LANKSEVEHVIVQTSKFDHLRTLFLHRAHWFKLMLSGAALAA